MALEVEVDRLYGLPLQEFTAARNMRVRELRKAGRKGDAAAVRELRKPSASAWAVNQLARRHPQEMNELLRSGADLRKAQRDVLAGKSGADVRAASRRQHELADELVSAARELLAEAGTRVTPALAQRISGTLRAASVDPAAADDLRKGRLTEDVEAVGFGPLLHVARTRTGKRQAGQKRIASPAARKRLEAAKSSIREERRNVAEAQRAADRARRAAEKAQVSAERAQRRLEAAERRAAEAQTALRRP